MDNDSTNNNSNSTQEVIERSRDHLESSRARRKARRAAKKKKASPSAAASSSSSPPADEEDLERGGDDREDNRPGAISVGARTGSKTYDNLAEPNNDHTTTTNTTNNDPEENVLLEAELAVDHEAEIKALRRRVEEMESLRHSQTAAATAVVAVVEKERDDDDDYNGNPSPKCRKGLLYPILALLLVAVAAGVAVPMALGGSSSASAVGDPPNANTDAPTPDPTNSGTVDPTTTSTSPILNEILKLNPTDGFDNDMFGNSVAVSGDIVVVGAYQSDTTGEDSGSAYVFRRSGGNQIYRLVPEDGMPGNQFGYSVDVSSDTIVVGAFAGYRTDLPSDLQPVPDRGVRGAAYLFSAAKGEQLLKIMPPMKREMDGFGHSVAIDGNIVVVGAPFDDENGFHSGAAYVFNAVDGTQLYKLLPKDIREDNWFGYSVAISGDTIVVGANLDDDSGQNSGSVYVFNASDGQMRYKLLPEDGMEYDFFGEAVAVSGNTLVVGAPYKATNGADSGIACVYKAVDATPVHKLFPEDGAAGDSFGSSVAVDGDVIVVGSPYSDAGGHDSGAAYAFSAEDGSQLYKMLPQDGFAGDVFGAAVAAQDGIIVVGASMDADGSIETGSAYIF